MKKIITTSIILLLVAITTSCGLKGIPVPADKKDYIGYWSGDNITLSIDESGKVEYKKTEGNSSTSVNGPIQKFEGNNFVVGALGINTTFVVSATPHEDAGVWKMTVDNVELTKN